MAWEKLLLSAQPQAFLAWTPSSFEKSLVRFYTTLLEEPLQVAFRDVGGGNLFITVVPETDQSGSIIFKSDDYAGQVRC
jgi:hypothetical protein